MQELKVSLGFVDFSVRGKSRRAAVRKLALETDQVLPVRAIGEFG